MKQLITTFGLILISYIGVAQKQAKKESVIKDTAKETVWLINPQTAAYLHNILTAALGAEIIYNSPSVSTAYANEIHQFNIQLLYVTDSLIRKWNGPSKRDTTSLPIKHDSAIKK